MPAARLLSSEVLAMELAAQLHPVIPASTATLCLDLRCRPGALRRAARELTAFGVHVTEDAVSHEWLADRVTWDACQSLACGYVDGVHSVSRRRK